MEIVVRAATFVVHDVWRPPMATCVIFADAGGSAEYIKNPFSFFCYPATRVPTGGTCYPYPPKANLRTKRFFNNLVCAFFFMHACYPYSSATGQGSNI